MRPTVRLVLITALRDRLFQSLFALLAAVIAVSVFIGSSAISEAQETVSVYVAGTARVVVIFGLIVFVAFHIERLVDTREIEAILSRTLSRTQFLIAYWLGLAVVTTLFVIPVGLLVSAVSVDMWGALFWTLTVVFESYIVVAFAVFAGLSFGRAVPCVFATVGFYAMARSLGFLTGITTAIYRPKDGVNEVINPYIDFLGLVLPRLDLFGQTKWLVYGIQPDQLVWIFPVQAVVYISLLLLAASFDLSRKQF